MAGLVATLTTSGPLAVFVIFLLPWGPGAIAGIILARHDGLSSALIIALYVLSDVVTACILEPLVQLLRNRGQRSRLGRRIFDAMSQVGGVTQVTSGRLGVPLGLFTFTFATDFFTASFVSTGLRLSRLIAWLCIIAGDVLWFLILFLAALGFAAFLSDDRLLFVVTMVIGLALPQIMRRVFRRLPTAQTEGGVAAGGAAPALPPDPLPRGKPSLHLDGGDG
jgi:hypothetical protein